MTIKTDEKGDQFMINRELTRREKEIYEMIPDDKDDNESGVVGAVRMYMDDFMYNERKRLKFLHNR